MGSLSASPHRIAALSAVKPPSTVKALRSFIGAYKYIGRVIRWHSNYINPLDQMVAGRDTREQIKWTEESLDHFHRVQESLKSCVPVTIAKPSDHVWIQTDGALRPGAPPVSGLAATLFLLRDGKVLLVFSSMPSSRKDSDCGCHVRLKLSPLAPQIYTSVRLSSNLNIVSKFFYYMQ